MSSTQVTNLDLSEPREELCAEEIPEKINDIITNAGGQEVTVSSNEEKPKDKDVESKITVEEQEQEQEKKEQEKEQEQPEEITDKQQKDAENDSASKESDQQELNNENSTTVNANANNANETEQVLEENNDQTTLSGWSAVWDENAQAYYYWNTITNETTWENPSNNINNHGLTTQISNPEYTEYTEQDYYQYYYGYYPEVYHYGYDHSTLVASSGVATTSAATTEPPTNPLDSLLDKIDKEIKSKLDGDSSKPKSPSTSDSQNNDQQEQVSSPADVDQHQTETSDSEYQSFLAEHGGNDGGGGDYKLTARFNARTGKFQRDPTLNPEKFSADAKAIRQMSYFFDYDQFTETRGSAAANKRLSSEASLDDSIRSHKKLNKKDIEMFKQKKKEKKEMKKKSWLLSDD